MRDGYCTSSTSLLNRISTVVPNLACKMPLSTPSAPQSLLSRHRLHPHPSRPALRSRRHELSYQLVHVPLRQNPSPILTPTHTLPSKGHPRSDPSTNPPPSPSSTTTALPELRRHRQRLPGQLVSSQPNSLQTTTPLNRRTQKRRRSSRTSAGTGVKSLKLSLEASLKKLRTDYIDSMYLHCESTVSCHIGELLTRSRVGIYGLDSRTHELP